MHEMKGCGPLWLSVFERGVAMKQKYWLENAVGVYLVGFGCGCGATVLWIVACLAVRP